LGTILQQSLSVLFFLGKKSDQRELCLKLPQFIKKYHMIKKLLLLLLLIVFVNPIFAQIEQLGIKQRGAATTAFTKETELTIEKPDGVKTGDIMIVTIAQKRAMTVTLFQSGGH
jgi:hypothetical protein